MFCFFFSSRRRHTRLQGDWSSDVCSSDLFAVVNEAEIREARRMVEELEGISPCFSAAAALAGLVWQRLGEGGVGGGGGSWGWRDHLKKKKKEFSSRDESCRESVHTDCVLS